MQWDKVKNILIVILLAVNLFMLGNLALKSYNDHHRAVELRRDVQTLLEARGIALDDGFTLPDDLVLPQLSVDRSRTEEEQVAFAMLGTDAARSEDDEGNVRYESTRGMVTWSGDGTVQGSIRQDEGVPADDREALRRARQLFERWGLKPGDGTIEVVEHSIATLSGPVAGMAVHNRHLTLFFGEDGTVQLTGYWSFGVPYTLASETGVSCSAADALLAFVAEHPEVKNVYGMDLGYRLLTDSSRRLQLVPTWKIKTDSIDFLVDCAKKTTI